MSSCFTAAFFRAPNTEPSRHTSPPSTESCSSYRRMSRGKLDEVMALSTKHDWDIATHAWFRYNRITADIAHRHLFPAYVGAAVFAALSPNSDYIGNLRDTNRLLEAVRLRK